MCVRIRTLRQGPKCIEQINPKRYQHPQSHDRADLHWAVHLAFKLKVAGKEDPEQTVRTGRETSRTSWSEAPPIATAARHLDIEFLDAQL